ncbi:MAG: methylenetetrahydrofolate reductase [Dehalococcoidia bacterium]|nr:methylenetetrahydrofolate reductase [Dehalococcoidia bacterium]
MKAGSNLERVLGSGIFAVTGELGPPQSAAPEVIREKSRLLKGNVDAFNATDGQTAIVRMASWAACLIGMQEGLEPTVQMTCRDRNRLALQMDILGIAALGMKNILCLTGDHQSFGNHPQAKGVFDIDSIQFIQMAKNMRDEKKFQCGDEISVAPSLFIGAAENPFADPFDFRVTRLAKKVAAGADFIQTQIIYNVDKFARWMEEVRARGLHKDVYILAGVAPIKSAGAARYMKTKVPGMDVPDEVVERMAGAPKGEARRVGIDLCVDIINQVRQIEGVAGVHIMAIEWEEAVAEICEKAGLLPRPKLSA